LSGAAGRDRGARHHDVGGDAEGLPHALGRLDRAGVPGVCLLGGRRFRSKGKQTAYEDRTPLRSASRTTSPPIDGERKAPAARLGCLLPLSGGEVASRSGDGVGCRAVPYAIARLRTDPAAAIAPAPHAPLVSTPRMRGDALM